MKQIALISIVLFIAGCADKVLMPCQTPTVKKADKGKDELEFLNNVFIEKELLRAANAVCKTPQQVIINE